MNPYPIWIWQNASDKDNSLISWCSTEHYGTLEAITSDLADYLQAEFIARLRDRQATLSLTDLVGHKIAATFEYWLLNLKPNAYLRIELLVTLPTRWQELPLEHCQQKGHQLSERMQVIRYAPLPKKAIVQSITKKITLFNLWPKDEYDQNFFQLLEEMNKAKNHFKVVRKKKKCNVYLKNHDLSHHSILWVIAHGNEKVIDKPLQTETRTPWSLHTTHLPPLVILLACGGEEGNLQHYALKLLQDSPHADAIKTAYGAKTVLVAKGTLNAPRTAIFLEKFVEKWEEGQSADAILHQLQGEKNSEHAAKRMQIIGQSDLRQWTKEKDSIINWNELKMAARYSDNAMIMLLNRLSYHCLIKYSSLEKVVEKLYQALNYKFNDPHEKKSLVYDPLDRVYPHCDGLTQAWLSYFLMYLSSIHNHNNIKQYNDEVIKYQAVGFPHKAIFIFYAAEAKYRQRNHVKAIQFVMDGFRLLAQEKRSIEKSNGCSEAEYKLAELAINILIDVSFADIAAYFVRHVDRCIQTLDEEQSDNESFTQLDRKARLAIRMGDLENEMQGEAGLQQCVRKLDKKRCITKGNGNRELSFLLICSSWLDTPKTCYIKDTLEVLAPIGKIIKKIIEKTGNTEELYLLKGLANWAWRQEDQTAVDLLQHYKPVLLELCEQTDLRDAGPLGSIIACMRLIDKEDRAIQQAWMNITEKMHEQFHYFELTMFYALLDEEKKSARYYKEFKEQQETILDTLKQLEPELLDVEFYDALLLTEQAISLLPMNANHTVLSTDLDDIRRYGIVPF